MQTEVHTTLLKEIESLRSTLAKVPLTAVLYYCLTTFQKGVATDNLLSLPLSAPMRQLGYLLGLAISRPEPQSQTEPPKVDWSEIEKSLESIYRKYFEMFLTGRKEVKPQDLERWHSLRDVLIPGFLNYHTQGTLATAEQVALRVKSVFTRFDSELQQSCGLSATSALNITAWVTGRIQRESDLWSAMLGLWQQSNDECWSHKQTQAAVATDPTLRSLDGVRIGEFPFAILRTEMAAEFGEETTAAFWEFMVTQERGQVEYIYPTEPSPATRRPLFQVAPGIAVCPIGNWLYTALYEGFLEIAESHSFKEAVLSQRDRVLEQQVEQVVRSFFGPSAEYYSCVYETSDATFEHDLIVLWRSYLLVFESKASPPVPPFRDPEKAYTRLLHAFRGKNGIQKAYEQAHQVSQVLARESVIKLHDHDGNVLREIVAGEVETVFSVCVTADHYGPLATDLALLLEKKASDPYPWAVCVTDLEAFLGGLRRKGWGPSELCQYLRERSQLHGKVFTDDELELAGAFLLRGDLNAFARNDADQVFVTPGFAHVFDQIYMESHGGPPAQLTASGPVVITDLRKELFAPKIPKAQVDLGRFLPSPKPMRVGRNDQCPCGSGKKFKKCCG